MYIFGGKYAVSGNIEHFSGENCSQTICILHNTENKCFKYACDSAAKLAALSWDPENLEKLSLNAYLQVFATKMPYLQIFATKMPYLQVFATKIALLNYMTKPSVWL